MELHDIWLLLKRNLGYNCVYIQRSQNDLVDFLAKKGRSAGYDIKDATYLILPP